MSQHKTFTVILLIFLLFIYLELLKIRVTLEDNLNRASKSQELLYKSILADGYIADKNDNWIKKEGKQK